MSFATYLDEESWFGDYSVWKKKNPTLGIEPSTIPSTGLFTLFTLYSLDHRATEAEEVSNISG